MHTSETRNRGASWRTWKNLKKMRKKVRWRARAGLDSVVQPSRQLPIHSETSPRTAFEPPSSTQLPSATFHEQPVQFAPYNSSNRPTMSQFQSSGPALEQTPATGSSSENEAAWQRRQHGNVVDSSVDEIALIRTILDANTLYEVLQVNTDMVSLQITRQFRRLALHVHPDRNGAHDATQAFQRLQHAYETLVDPTRREAYDRTLASTSSEPPRRTSSRSTGTVPESAARTPERHQTSRTAPAGAASRASPKPHSKHAEPPVVEAVPFCIVFFIFLALFLFSIADPSTASVTLVIQ